MRALFVLMALSLGANSFAGGRPQFRIHVWQCNAVNSGIDHGYSVGVDQDSRKGLVAHASMQSIAGPQQIGEWKVTEVKPTVGRGNWGYLDTATRGAEFSLTINAAGAGKFRAKDKRGNPRSAALRCFRTRRL